MTDQIAAVDSVGVARLAAVLAGHAEIRNSANYTVRDIETAGANYLARCDAEHLPTRGGYRARAVALLDLLGVSHE